MASCSTLPFCKITGETKQKGPTSNIKFNPIHMSQTKNILRPGLLKLIMFFSKRAFLKHINAYYYTFKTYNTGQSYFSWTLVLNYNFRNNLFNNNTNKKIYKSWIEELSFQSISPAPDIFFFFKDKIHPKLLR